MKQEEFEEWIEIILNEEGHQMKTGRGIRASVNKQRIAINHIGEALGLKPITNERVEELGF